MYFSIHDKNIPMPYTFFYSIVCCLLFNCQVFSQGLSSTNKKALHNYQLADNLMQQRKFDDAKQALYAAIEKDPNFVEAYMKLGAIHKLFGDKEKARNAFKKAAELKPNFKPMAGAYYVLADYSFTDGQYEDAKKYYQMVLAVKPDDRFIIDQSEKGSKNCDFAIEAKKHPLDFKPIRMSPVINNFYVQAYPILTADQQTMIYYVIRTGERNAKGDIMISKKENGVWTFPVSISENINTPADEGAPSMSADGRSLVFAACNRPDAIGGCDIYISYKEGDNWSEPINMGREINSNAWDSEPSISADGRTLYFSSERNGGQGKMDIWYSKLIENGSWTKAQNMGPGINTKGDEVAPFIHANGNTLYFSSNNLPGMGGYDIFYVKKEGSGWTEPKNIGYPINTPDNEGTVYITVDGTKGYYYVYDKKIPVNPPSTLFEFDMPKELQEEHKSTYAKGTVYDAVTKKKLSAKIELIDIKTNQVKQHVGADPVTGEYMLILTEGSEYALNASKEGYLFMSRYFDYQNPTVFNPVALDIYLDPIKQGASVVLNNIFFANNSYELEDKSTAELDKIISFLSVNPSIMIELGGHTDDVGSDAANLELSQKRAKSVYDYLVSAGVVPAKLRYKGYGETHPISPNTTEENRAKNRRIEFKVL
ncbi:MAG TPA: OmpA family protein [Cytophagaceae bacterium]|jgi:OOP family OmpA-OmpF porin|nr:OmpA family protein [Cytophagaceae bacterium]